MLDHRLRRWPNIATTLGQCIVFAGWLRPSFYDLSRTRVMWSLTGDVIRDYKWLGIDIDTLRLEGLGQIERHVVADGSLGVDVRGLVNDVSDIAQKISVVRGNHTPWPATDVPVIYDIENILWYYTAVQRPTAVTAYLGSYMYLLLHGSILPCRAKMQYMFTFKVMRIGG